MGQRRENSILLLSTGSPLAGRCAEALVNSVTRKMGLAWTATLRTLAAEAGSKKAGKLPPAALKIVNAMGLRATEEWTCPPAPLAADDLQQADRIVALNQAVQLPLLQERFPDWAEKVECWEIDDSLEALARIEAEVMDLAARLIRGGERQKAPPVELCPECGLPVSACTCITRKRVPTNVTVRVGRETKGRHGKGVTTISDLPLAESELHELAVHLKQRLGTGGTAKEGRIEIQGDQRERIVAELEKLGYRVKRAGG